MNKFIILLLLLLSSAWADAQTVMGIDIKTTMKSFNPQMIKKGYKPHVTTLGKYEYNVTFAGYPHCRYVVEYNTETDSIYEATIYFLHESVSKDGEIYKELKKQLTAKYGKPTFDFEVDYADWEPSILARLEYRNVSFNYNPYLIWQFGDEKQVKMSYQTGASRKVKKPSYSNDI